MMLCSTHTGLMISTKFWHAVLFAKLVRFALSSANSSCLLVHGNSGIPGRWKGIIGNVCGPVHWKYPSHTFNITIHAPDYVQLTNVTQSLESLAEMFNRVFVEVIDKASCQLLRKRRTSGQWTRAAFSDIQFLECEKTSWVFTYNSYSPSYDYMMKLSVVSAQMAGLLPICVFSGVINGSAGTWLKMQGVHLVRHVPVWANLLWNYVSTYKDQNYLRTKTPLFRSKEGVVGAFQRIDIPILDTFLQFEYILFTDIDVIFNKPIPYSNIFHLQAEMVLMAPESYKNFPYNSGVMIFNIDNLKSTYPAFLDFIIASGKKNGLNYPGYGPVDQGAYNSFYRTFIEPHPLPNEYNVNPQDPVPIKFPSIIHFRGPKPHHYMEFSKNNTCSFPRRWLCAVSFVGFCKQMNMSLLNQLCSAADCQQLPLLCNTTLTSPSQALRAWFARLFAHRLTW